MRHVTQSLIVAFATLTVLSACSSPTQHRHDSDKTRSHADDAHQEMERQEQKQP